MTAGIGVSIVVGAGANVAGVAGLLAGILPRDVPVDPTAPDARQLLLDELGKPEYQAARPTLLDRAASAVGDWLASLTVPSNGNLGGLLPALGVLVLVALIVVAFILYGRPRRNRRVALLAEPLFGSDDRRSAAALRASAAVAANAGDYETAIEEVFRAIARRQAERTVVRVSPGTTAREFAVRAGVSYPIQRDQLVDGSAVFDDVRYLRRPATRSGYEQLAGLEGELRDLSPAVREAAGAP